MLILSLNYPLKIWKVLVTEFYLNTSSFWLKRAWTSSFELCDVIEVGLEETDGAGDNDSVSKLELSWVVIGSIETFK